MAQPKISRALLEQALREARAQFSTLGERYAKSMSNEEYQALRALRDEYVAIEERMLAMIDRTEKNIRSIMYGQRRKPQAIQEEGE